MSFTNFEGFHSQGGWLDRFSVLKYFCLTRKPGSTSIATEYFLHSEIISTDIQIYSFELQKVKPENTQSYIRVLSNLKFNKDVKSMF